jgi:PKD repeat protein
MANPQLPVSYQFDLTVSPTDLEGNPVTDALTWTSSDATGATTLTVDDATTLKVTVAAPVLATPVSPLPLGIVVAATDVLGNATSYTFDVVADVATKLAVAASAPVKIPAA